MEINLSKLKRQLMKPIAWLIKQVLVLYQDVRYWFEVQTGQRARSRLRGRSKRRDRQGGLAGWLAGGRVGKRRTSKKSKTGSDRVTEARKKLNRVRLVRFVALGAFACAVLGIVAFFGMFAYFSRDLPEPGKIVRREGFSTKIYDRNGTLLYDLFDEERRVPVKLDQVPAPLRQATIAIEDKDFYHHSGFDLLTILRIPYNIIVRRRLVGGSTLTQQLVKNVLLSNARTIPRKFKELVLAMQIERTFTKDQILEMYLNEAPYGGTAWGVGAAAELYFAKSVAELNLVESAFLAGLPQRPSAYSPYGGKTDSQGEPLWKVRTKGVLRRMQEDHYITADKHQQALKELEQLKFEKGALAIRAPHFVMYVKDQLIEMYGEDLVERGGLQVTTSLDLDLHEQAQEIVTNEVDDLEDYHITNGALLMMEPDTGQIISMVGSRDYFDQDKGGQFNVVVDGLRQPGSSIKPVTYLGLFRKGYNPATMLVDAPTDFRRNEQQKSYTPRNYDGEYRGPVSVRSSLGSSLNVPAVKALALVGVEDFLHLAYSMGFESLKPTKANLQRFGLALTLGGGEVHLIDTVTAYSSFANGGLKVKPVSVLEVKDRHDQLIYQHHPVRGRRIFSQAEAYLINHVLSDNNARLHSFSPNSLLNTGKPIAVKTGTTNDMRDNWTIGWSQDIMVGSWVGNNDNSPMTRVASGITGASPIWRQAIMAALEAGYQAPEWERPENVEEVEVDAISGYPKHDEFPSRTDVVIKGTLPPLPDPIHKKVRVCEGENKLATEAQIAEGDYDKREVIDLRRDDPISEDGKNRWMEGINKWIESQDDSRYEIPTEYCGDAEEVSVKIEEPDDKEEFDDDEIEVKIRAGSGDGIDRIELYVDGDKRETIEDDSYDGKLKLERGQHELYAKAYSNADEKAESDKIRIGTGGAPWDKPEPSPTPKPTKQPTAAPTSTPTSAPPPEEPTNTPAPAPTVEPTSDGG